MDTNEMLGRAVHKPSADLAPANQETLIRNLHERHLRTVYADYWICYNSAFVADGTVTFGAVDVVRDTEMQATARRLRTRVWLIEAGTPRDRELAARLAHFGITVHRESAGAIAIYTLDRYLDPIAAQIFRRLS